jgi:serine protease Do
MNETSHTGSPRTGLLRRRRTALLAGALSLGVAGMVAGEAFLVPATPAMAEAVKVPGNAAQMPSFADVVAAVEPAVVSIRVKAEARPQTSMFDGMPRGGPFEWFREFGPRSDRGEGGQGAPGLPNRGQRGFVTGQGSGFFISGDGYVVTNNHVVDGASEVKVTMDDGAEYDAKVIGVDEKTDVALLKVDAERDFPYVTFDDGDIRVGEWVVAVGNPFGLGGSVTAGIVSARGRDIGAGPYDDFIQIDAPINKGNSGGPTFNLQGEVVGVNTAIYSPSGGSVGIGFAIPAATVEQIVEDLKDDGNVTRGWLGVQIQGVNADIADSLGLKDAKGALVTEPQADGPAVAAGIKSGDTITAVDGKAVNDPRDLARRIAGYAPNTDVKITVWRDGKQEEITVKLGTLPTDGKRADAATGGTGSDLAQLGLSVAPAASVGMEDSGLAVVEVDPNGPAAERGLQVGDVIVAVGGQPVGKSADVTAGIEAAKGEGRKAVLFQVKSGENVRYVALPIDKA